MLGAGGDGSYSKLESPLVAGEQDFDVTSADLTKLAGVVVRRETQWSEALARSFGLPYDQKNLYTISGLPEGKTVADDPFDPHYWRPTNEELQELPVLLRAKEESSLAARAILACCGGLNLRGLRLNFFTDNRSASGDALAGQVVPSGVSGEQFHVKRPCRCGIKGTAVLFTLLIGVAMSAVATLISLYVVHVPEKWLPLMIDGPLLAAFLFCAPFGLWLVSLGTRHFRLQMTAVEPNGTPIGLVAEDFDPLFSRWLDCMFRCTHYDAVYEAEASDLEAHHRYTTRVNLCCCGRRNNCCGASCCKNDLVMDILDPESGAVVATVQKTYAPSRQQCGACCRMCQRYNTYLLTFPRDATQRQRALLLTALMQVEYQHFEKKGGDKGG